MIIVETPIFTSRILALMSDEEYQALQKLLILNPGTGALLKGSNGLRKVRWRLSGKGKSQGVRVIYYWQQNSDEIRMLYVYRKSDQPDLTPTQLKALIDITKRW